MTHLTDQIDATVRDGGDITACEDFIDRQVQLTQDARSALWLYAWVVIPREQARYEALRTLDALS